MSDSDQAVIQTAKDKPVESDIHTLDSGVRVRIHSVAPSLVNEVMLRIPQPEVPMVWSDRQGKEIPNPLAPSYISAIERYELERGKAALDAAVMFGFELVDGLPEDGRWIKKLKMLGIEFDESDPDECEFYYKKLIAMSTQDLRELQSMLGVTAEGIEKAKKVSE
jgi:hypothetical protein